MILRVSTDAPLLPRALMLTIAIIDQDADSRLLARAVLGGEFAVAEFESAERAARELPALRPDLVLLDVALPGADGLFMLEWLRSAPGLRHVPVVAFTAAAMHGSAARLVRAGFDATVRKPLADEAELLEPVRRLLSRGTPRRDARLEAPAV